MYGWGSDTFTRPEAQFYNFPFAYFKGPSAAILTMSIDVDSMEGTGIVNIIELCNRVLCMLLY